MIIELAEKNIIDIVRDNLENLKKVEDDSVREIVGALEGALKDYDDAVESQVQNTEKVDDSIVKDEVKESEAKEEVKAEEKVEETEAKEEVKETETVETETEKVSVEGNQSPKVVAGEIQLSLEVADKLKEAALELDAKDNEINDIKLELSAKDEIISGYKNKIVELTSSIKLFKDELTVYKKKQELELKQQKENIIKDLIELYANLNIVKSSDSLQTFGLSQLVELRKALEVTLDKKNTPVRETVNSQAKVIVQQQQKESVDTTKETFEGLFGKNPDLI